MLDLTPLPPEARPIVAQAAPIYMRHTAPWFVGLIVHGSALKGGFIPGCSDIDLHLYLEQGAFAAPGQLPLPLYLAIQRDLSRINPAPFRYIQCQARSSVHTPGDLLGPIPGAYHALTGRLPVPEATAEELLHSARQALGRLDPLPAFLTGGLLDHGGGRLQAQVRLLVTKVWPVLYHTLTLQTEDPIRVWRLPKEAAIALLPPASPLSARIRAFLAAVRRYYPAEARVEGALAVIETGVAFLQEAQGCTARRFQPPGSCPEGPY